MMAKIALNHCTFPNELWSQMVVLYVNPICMLCMLPQRWGDFKVVMGKLKYCGVVRMLWRNSPKSCKSRSCCHLEILTLAIKIQGFCFADLP